MSSYLRTIQKRILKKMGYVRQSHEVRTHVDGTSYIHRFSKGQGKIIGPNGEMVGQHYPQVVAPRS